MTESTVSSFVDESPGEVPVRGTLHRAANASGDFLVLTHGAGGNSNAALLVAVAEELASAGISVLRCDLPYRQRRPQGPPSPAFAKEDQEGLRRAITLMKARFSGRAFLGGSSYGGRQASLLAPRIRNWSKDSCCFPTLSIPPESPRNCELLIFRSCVRHRCS